jgi:hypothetical protein
VLFRSGNRQQATGNRQQATGNYTHHLTNRVNYLTVTLVALATTLIERLHEVETITAYISKPFSFSQNRQQGVPTPRGGDATAIAYPFVKGETALSGRLITHHDEHKGVGGMEKRSSL